jgi:hypothetical protein
MCERIGPFCKCRSLYSFYSLNEHLIFPHQTSVVLAGFTCVITVYPTLGFITRVYGLLLLYLDESGVVYLLQ